MFFDISMIVLIPGILLGMYAQAKVSSAYNKYSRVLSASGYTGAEFARKMLNDNGLYDVTITQISGKMSDHYDPRARQVRLSAEVYNGTSIASLGIASHEVGHAIQHATHYFPLTLRNMVIPATNISSSIYFPLIFLGLILNSTSLFGLGIALFAIIVIFQLITLPVEFNASHRAIVTLGDDAVLAPAELKGAKKMLSAAALTYVAALVTGVLQLLQLIIMFSGRDE
ncbi:MAG: zinc metallopeptidase [Peptococcaceae bacterium]|nr:zinc metallopeptidase [Peptococcaceae bacterium]